MPTDLGEREKMLLAGGGSKALIDEAKVQSQGLGIFPPAKVAQLVQVLDDIRHRAAA